MAPRQRTAELQQVGYNEWVAPALRGYLMVCCGCGLRHRMDFRRYRGRLHRGQIQFRARRLRRQETPMAKKQAKEPNMADSTLRLHRSLKKEVDLLRDQFAKRVAEVEARVTDLEERFEDEDQDPDGED